MLDLHFKADRIVTEASDTVVPEEFAPTRSSSAPITNCAATLSFRSPVLMNTTSSSGRYATTASYSTLTELKFLINRYSLYFRATPSISGATAALRLSSYDKHEVGLSVTAHY